MRKKISSLLNGVAAMALLMGALLSPVNAAPNPQAAAPAATYVPVDSLTVTGPKVGVVGSVYYTFEAVAGPSDATLDIDFFWQVTDQPPLANYGVAGVTDSQEFAWQSPGVKTVRVGAMNCGPNNPTFYATWQIMIGPLPLSDAPQDARQRAALHLEEQRASGQSPEWEQARLSDSVRPLFRPDLDEPAYYEFAVVAPSLTQGAGPGAVIEDEPAGFIIVSTAEHDYPITNWSTGGLPPSERMRQEAKLGGQTATKFFKLDVLSYVAEDDAGQPVAFDGDTPPKVTGMPPEWLINPPPIVEVVAQPQIMHAEDPLDGSVTVTYTVLITNPIDIPMQFEDWDSWDELKEEYADVYAGFLQALGRKAAVEWEAERSAQEYGYTLFKGDSIAFPLLWPDPIPTFSGPGLALVEVDVVEPPGVAPRLLITATSTVPRLAVPLTATIGYSNGMSETVKVMVVHQWQYYMPLVDTHRDGGPTPGGGVLQGASVSEASVQNDYTLGTDGYFYWYATGMTKAGADSKQAWYKQYSGACKSGCGPTAWAMLIAWGDRQAAYQDPLGGNRIWAGRWGLYRYNGGRSASDSIAPTSWNDAAEAAGVQNMTWEINGQVLTWCNGFNDNGATWPTDMHRVTHYLNGRSGMAVKTWALVTGFEVFTSVEENLIKYAKNVLRNPMATRRPTIIGTGFFSHYPLAYGYRIKQEQVCTYSWTDEGETASCGPKYYENFYVNQGWGGSAGEWVAADLFFTGRLTPHTSYVDDVALYRASNRYFFYDYQHDAVHDKSHAPFGWYETIRPAVGDFDRDGVLDDVAAFIYAHDNVATRYDWSFDYNNNRTMDKSLDRWTYFADGWPMALDADRDGWVDDIAVYSPALKSWSWNKDHTAQSGSDGSCLYDQIAGFPADGRPVTGDFNRDGYHDDVAIFSPSTGMWRFDYRSNGCGIDRTFGPWGTSGDLPIAGDFDKDGWVDDVGLYASGGDRYWRYDYDANATNLNQIDKQSSAKYGAHGDLPIAGNFDTN
jgi:hypothetical protein